MALPNPGMDAVPFTPLTAEFLDDMIENIESLSDGTGFENGAITTNTLAESAVTRSKVDSTTFPKVHAYRAAAVNSSAGTGAKVVFDTETIDTHNAYSTSTGVFTAPYTGDYFISIGGGNTAATSTVMYWYIKRNGTTIRQGTVWSPSNVNNRQTLTTTVSLTASDTIECWYVGGGGSVIAVGQENLFLDINYLP